MVNYFELNRIYPIKCKAYLPSSKDVKTIILGVHGFAGDKESSMLSELAESIEMQGGALICFDFPAHGDSDRGEENLTVENCINDLLAVASWIDDTYPDAQKAIFATSFGGYISLLSLSKLTNYKVILRAPAVTMPKVLLETVLGISATEFEHMGVVQTGFERTIELPYSFYKELVQKDVHGLNFDNQTLVFHGDRDDIVPIEDVLQYCNGRENVKLSVIKNADHRFKNKGEFERIVSETVRFLETTSDRMKIVHNPDIEKVKRLLLHSKHAVFFGGAGVSTESGIPDFRGTGGLYDSEESNEYYLSRDCLKDEPEKFFQFFRKNMVFENAKPNSAHYALSSLEKRGIIKAVITQNIDGLHQKAGSERVIELHGASNRCYCTKCGRVFDNRIIAGHQDVPCCDQCGSLVRPDVTLYGEPLDGFNYADARQEISEADVLIVGGISLVVNPAASLIGTFRGPHLIIINYMSTPYDEMAEYVIRESISDVLSFFEK